MSERDTAIHLAINIYDAYRDGRRSLPDWHQLEQEVRDEYIAKAEAVLMPTSPPPKSASREPEETYEDDPILGATTGTIVRLEEPLPPGIYLLVGEPVPND